MVRGSLNKIIFKYAFISLLFLLIGCQSSLDEIGNEHAKEVEKWQELARYAGNELKHLGLTITAGVQINKDGDNTSFSIIKVQLNKNANYTDIDLLSPEFAEKFACGKECERLGLYATNFSQQETQLSSFFFEEEGRFFEFYGRLTILNNTLADYRASSPDILNKYFTLMLNRKLAFNSLSEFLDYIEVHVTEDNLLAFSKSGFISPATDRLSSTFKDDVLTNLSDELNIDETARPSNDWQVDNTENPSDYWQVDDVKLPSDGWTNDDVLIPEDIWSNNSLLSGRGTSVGSALYLSWDEAKQKMIKKGSLACTFSDNSFGVVEEIDRNRVTLEVVAEAKVLIDGLKLYPQSGYLFTAADSFYFVKNKFNKTYPRSDVASCDMKHLKRG